MITVEDSTKLQSICNIRLMQKFRPVEQEKRDVSFAEILGREMRNESNVADNKRYAD